MQLVASLALLAIAATGVIAQPQINTPASIVECEPTQLTYSGGSPPYIISILPGGQVTAPAIETLGTETGNSVTWNADIASGTSITFEIRDSVGSVAYSAIVTIQAGSSNSCVGKNSLSSGSASGTASASSGSSSGPASGASTTAAPTASSNRPTGSSSGGASASSASATSPATGSATSAGASASASSTAHSAAMRLNSGSASGIIGMVLAALLL